MKAAVIGSQDAGEPFFSGKNSKGYDYYSFFLQLRKFGRLKSLVVGRYRARFGMGLVMNTNFTLGKAHHTLIAGSRNHTGSRATPRAWTAFTCKEQQPR